MAITKTWSINTMERDVSDGYVTKVVYCVKCLSDSVEKAREKGYVTFTKPSSLPSDFIPYVQGEIDKDGNVTKAGTPNAATVLGWVKTKLGDDVAKIETRLEAEVNELITPTTASGVPW